jgi:hypothetical protein
LRRKDEPLPFEPRFRRSQMRGLLVLPNHRGIEFYNTGHTNIIEAPEVLPDL